MSSKANTINEFIQAAPPGQLQNVVDDIKALTVNEPQLTQNIEPAFRKYNEEQFATVKLPGSSEYVLISPYNSLSQSQYYDTASSTSFNYNHTTSTASNTQSHVPDSSDPQTLKSLNTSIRQHLKEHYPSPNSATGVYPGKNGEIHILLVGNRYSLNNFWSGRWRSHYVLDNGKVKGEIKVDVHYFEDGNVRMQTRKEVESAASGSGDVVRVIAGLEKRYQEELNRGFNELNEGVFKGLRRQLPVTRQRVEWDKVGAYRLGQDIGGGRSGR